MNVMRHPERNLCCFKRPRLKQLCDKRGRLSQQKDSSTTFRPEFSGSELRSG